METTDLIIDTKGLSKSYNGYWPARFPQLAGAEEFHIRLLGSKRRWKNYHHKAAVRINTSVFRWRGDFWTRTSFKIVSAFASASATWPKIRAFTNT